MNQAVHPVRTVAAEVAPLVSIGMPVYNGENYISQAIQSILDQTFTDFELIICDNASTDRTGEICRAFEKRDARIAYYCNAKNLGAGPNYDLCFHHARGRYFKWAAHDDLLAPDFLERAVTDLENDPGAVLWASEVVEIDPKGNRNRVIHDEIVGCADPHAATRFKAMISNHRCTAFFGIFRRDALEGSQLHGTYADSDRVLLAEIALRGRIIYLSKPLFFNREHPDRYTSKLARGAFHTREEALNWLDTSHAGSRSLSHWIRLQKYLSVIGTHVDSGSQRLACYGQVVQWLFAKYTLRNLFLDLVWATSPRLVHLLLGTKRRLFGIRQDMEAAGREESVHGPDLKV